MVKQLQNKSLTFTSLLVTLPIFLSIFAEASKYSIIINNLIPVRVVLIILNMVGFVLFIRFKQFKGLFQDRLFVFLLAFILFSAFSFFYTLDLRNYFSLLAFYINILAFYSLLYVLKNSVTKVQLLFERIFLFTLLFINTLSLLNFIKTAYALKNGLYWGPIRVVSTITDENHYALFLVVAIFVCINFALTSKKIESMISYILLSYSGIVFFALRSRSAFIALATSFVVFIILGYLNKLSRNKLLISAIVLVVSIFIGFILFKPFTTTGTIYYISEGSNLSENTSDTKDSEVIKSSEGLVVIKTDYRFDTFDTLVEEKLPNFLSEASIKSHLALIYASIAMGFDNPITGVGLGSFDEALQRSNLIKLYQRYDPQAAQSSAFPAHTMYGQAFAEGGFIGFMLYLAIMYFMFKRYWFNLTNAKDYNNKVLALSFLSIFISYLVFSVFYNVHEEWFWIPAFIGLFIVDVGNMKYEI